MTYGGLGDDDGIANGIIQDQGGPGIPGTGACCLPDGSCQEGITETDCDSQGGTYQGDDTTCDQVTCPIAPPTAIPTLTEWGILLLALLLLATAGWLMKKRLSFPSVIG